MCVMAFKGDDVMPWYEQIKNGLKRGEIYSHKELTDKLKFLKPDLADSTYHWTISGLVRERQIVRLGYDAYSRPDSSTKKVKTKDIKKASGIRNANPMAYAYMIKSFQILQESGLYIDSII